MAEGYNIQLKKEGLDHLCVTAEDLKPLFGKVMTEIADAILATIDPKDRYDLMERCMDTENKYLYENPCHIGYEGIVDTIKKLSKNHRLFIVSNSQKGYPELCVEKLGIKKIISGHLCYGDTLTCKGETIKKLMADHNITSACYIGDTMGDMEASDYAGIPFVFCTYGFGTPDHYWKKVYSFEQLLEL